MHYQKLQTGGSSNLVISFVAIFFLLYRMVSVRTIRKEVGRSVGLSGLDEP